MNKKMLIILTFVVLIAAGCGVFFLIRGQIDNPKEGNIGDILLYQLDDVLITKDSISYIKTGDPFEQNENYSVSDFIDSYWNKDYKPYDGRTGSTAHTYYVAYDKHDRILFTLVDVGNNYLYYIKAGSFDINNNTREYLYQMQE